MIRNFEMRSTLFSPKKMITKLVTFVFQNSLCNTVLDNPHNNTKEDIVKSIIQYLETDTILFQSSVREQFSTFITFNYNI